MNPIFHSDPILSKNGFPPVKGRNKGRFFMLCVEIDKEGNQGHVHSHSDHFKMIYRNYLRLSDLMHSEFESGDLLSYWIMLVEETDTEYIRHGECEENGDLINKDRIVSWLEATAPDVEDLKLDYDDIEGRVYRFIHLIPLGQN